MNIYISWKVDSPSTAITKGSLRAVLVQCYSSSAPDDNHDDQYDLNDDLDNYNHDNDKKKRSLGAVLVQCYSSSTPDDLDNCDDDNDHKELFVICAGQVLLHP